MVYLKYIENVAQRKVVSIGRYGGKDKGHNYGKAFYATLRNFDFMDFWLRWRRR